jgi:signal transduction histidine kinase
MLRLHGRAEEVFLMLRSRSGEDLGMLSYAKRRESDGVYDCVIVPVRERAKFEEELLRARRAAEGANEVLERQKEELQRANDLLESQAVELELQGEQMREQAERLEQMAVAADEANRAKSSFLAMMSHELRTPLNAISGYLQILELGIAGPITDAQRDILHRLDQSGRHLLSLINDVLDLSRIEAGRIEYDIRDVVLADAVAGVTPLVEPQLAAKGIRFHIDVSAALKVRADVEKLRQIVVNLLGNAVKFTPDNGTVELGATTSPDNATVNVYVRDSGIGIPRDQHEAIFQPFVQVDSLRTRTAQGSGLGLAISRDLARGMSGDLLVESELGKGSTFTLSLPAVGARRTPVSENRFPADTHGQD